MMVEEDDNAGPLSDSELEEETGEWTDWNADESGADSGDEASTLCLFCKSTAPSAAAALQHCSREHGFDLTAFLKQYHLNLYDSIKVINYIRSQVSLLNCPRCSTHFTSRDALLAHLKEASHFGLSAPGPKSPEGTEQESTPRGPWDSASFLVPHLPDDPLLYSLEDQEGESEEEMEHGNEAQDEVGSLVSQSSGLPRTVSMDPGYEADVSMHGGKHAPGTSHVTRETRVPADSSSSSAGSEWGQRTSPGRGPSTRTLKSESGGASKQRVSFGEEPARSPGRVAANRGPPKAGGLKARVSVPAPLDSGLTRGLHEGDRLGLLERENEDLRAELAAMKIAQQETEDLQAEIAALQFSLAKPRQAGEESADLPDLKKKGKRVSFDDPDSSAPNSPPPAPHTTPVSSPLHEILQRRGVNTPNRRPGGYPTPGSPHPRRFHMMTSLGTPGSPHPRKFMQSPLYQGEGDEADDEGEEDDEDMRARGGSASGGAAHPPVVGLDEVAKKKGVDVEELVAEEEQLEEAEVVFGGDDGPQFEGDDERTEKGGLEEPQPASVLKKPGPHHRKAGHVKFAPEVETESQKRDESYFDSYSMFGIHREMLSDQVRTLAYKDAIEQNASLFQGKAVLDVGCGTGILSLIAASAGAAEVVGVDGSSKMAAIARQIAKANGFPSSSTRLSLPPSGSGQPKGIVKIVDSMIEKVERLPVGQTEVLGKVDVIVSEWMGYCLLYESMLDSVLYARDKFLRPGGAILPDTAHMFLAGLGRSATSLGFWENVYGFDMSTVGQEVFADAGEMPIVDDVHPGDVVTEPCLIQTFDLMTMKASEADFTTSFEIKAQLHPEASQAPASDLPAPSGTPSSVTCYALAVWFDTDFTARFCKDHPVKLSTSPFAPKTHWQQTILTLKEPVTLALPGAAVSVQGDAQVGSKEGPAKSLAGRISIVKSTKHRSIDISIELTAVAASGSTRKLPIQIFEL